jgi:hypothetical protein
MEEAETELSSIKTGADLPRWRNSSFWQIGGDNLDGELTTRGVRNPCTHFLVTKISFGGFEAAQDVRERLIPSVAVCYPSPQWLDWDKFLWMLR